MDRIQSIKSRAAESPWKIYGIPISSDKTHDFYHVPWRTDKHPSLAVRKKDAHWFDNPKKEHGDCLDYLERSGFSDAISEAEKRLGESPPKKEKAPAGTVSPKQKPLLVDKPTSPADGLVNGKMHTWAISEYGLPWSIYSEHECTVDGKRTIEYPLSCPGGSGTKFRPMARTKKNRTKRAAWHSEGCGGGYFPACLVGTTGRMIITAGEDKALACIHVGYPALSGSCGEAGINKSLANFAVAQGHTDLLVIMDGDAAGIKGAESAVEMLSSAGALSVRNWCPPDGMDLNDCLKKYGREWLAAELEKAWRSEPLLYTRAPDNSILPPLIPWGDNRKAEHAPQKWVIDGLLPCSLAAIYGAGKIGKSFLALSLMYSVATGRKFLNRTTHKGNVLFLDYEGNEAQWQRRMVNNLGFTGDEADSSFFYMRMRSSQHNLMEPAILGAVKERVRQIGNVRLIVIDTLERALKSTGRGKNAYQDDVARIEGIQEWAMDEEICICFIHHTRKNSAEGGEGYDDASGSRGITGTIENNLTLKRKSGDLFNINVQSRDVEHLDLPVVREGVKWRALDESEYTNALEQKMTNQQKAVLTVLKSQSWISPTLISNLSGVKSGTVKPMLLNWVQSGKLVTKPNGRSTLYALKESVFPADDVTEDDADE